jgi:hypothetical protein
MTPYGRKGESSRRNATLAIDMDLEKGGVSKKEVQGKVHRRSPRPLSGGARHLARMARNSQPQRAACTACTRKVVLRLTCVDSQPPQREPTPPPIGMHVDAPTVAATLVTEAMVVTCMSTRATTERSDVAGDCLSRPQVLHPGEQQERWSQADTQGAEWLLPGRRDDGADGP